MTDPATLLEHEIVCRECNGERTVTRLVSEGGPTTNGLEVEEPCPTCDGTGVEIDDRRQRGRPGGDIAREFTELRNALTIEHALLVETQRTLKIVSEQNRLLTRINADQSRLLDKADYRGGRRTA